MTEFNFAQDTIDIAPAAEPGRAEFRPCKNEEQAFAYWREQLAGIPAILELPTDRPRPPAQSFRTAREGFFLSTGLNSALHLLAEREGISLPILLLAAFQALLTRYTRQDDIAVGLTTPEFGKTQADTGSADAPVALPIRTDLSGDPRFRELLVRVSELVSRAREHQSVRWERVVQAVQPESDASRHPVCQVLFSFDHSEFISDSSNQNANLETDCGPSPFDLQLQLWERGDGLAAQFLYSTDLFDGATMRRMAGHYQRLLEGVVENPEERISRLPNLTDAERQQLVSEWNDTWMDYPRQLCVHQLIEAQASRTPNATAVVFGSERLSYGELDRRANQLANHLIKLGAKPDGLVGICLERSLDMVVGLLGILKAGAAYVPLDPAYPQARIAFMLEDAEVPLLLTQSQLTASLPNAGNSRVVLIDSHWPEISKQSQQSPALTLSTENRAYVIYTSGSTGKPKGVEIPHRGVVNFLTTMAKQPGMTSTDRLLGVTTLSFDIAGLEIYLPLTLGASIEIVSREIASDGNELLARLSQSGATVMQATPATWRMLLEAGWTGDPGLKILIGGEAVSQKLAAQLVERSASVWNMYGPTETTIWSTISKLDGHSTVSIGRPIANTEIFILDKMLQPVPIGVAGELHIGGDGLARGYLKRPELTAERFIVHPLNPDPKARLYKTGDLVRYLPNGTIDFLGRIDHQVKIRGFRIELGEIETVLRQHSAINDAVVVAREDTPGDKRVVAYFVATPGAAPTAAELRSFMKEKLPEYMLPSVLVTLRSMPLTPNGKVDRHALPAPDKAELASTGTFAAPKDAVESRLVQIWESVLSVRPIGIADNYFELGGHSLVAVRLMKRIEEAFGKNLPIAILLQAPTIEQLAVIVRQKGGAPAWSCLVPIQTGGSKPPFFCIHGINGAVVRFYDLSRYLGADQPFYGLQANGLEAGQVLHTRTEDMAAHYIKEIRRVQPQGPYFLGGYSFGGMIAFEMAQQLSTHGREDAVVVLFDTNFPEPKPSFSQKAASTSSALLTLFRVPASQRWAYLSRMVTVPVRMMQRWRHVARLPDYVKRVRTACLQAERDYTPRAYPGRVILFRSSHKPLGQLTDPRAGWHKYAVSGLEICEILGNHENILLEPQVRSVAEQLKTCLEAQPSAQIPLTNASQLEEAVQ
ncbi:MAG TPA: amino acid adenylation domain-containing protein [Candidatus Sulfotelmatobacter sp.]|nr:amino acid adenylation domain-containing protein [Candidatus Sulfotelmatobacter sp.]